MNTNSLKDKKIISRFTLICGAIWLLSILAVIVILFIATNGFRGVVQDTSFGNSVGYLTILLGSIAIGSLAYSLAILSFVYGLVRASRYKNTAVFFIKYSLILSFLPIYLLIFIFRQRKVFVLSKLLKIRRFRLSLKSINAFRLVIGLILVISILPIWLGGYYGVGYIAATELRLINESIRIAGTGSMYPTFPKGQGKTLQEQAKEIVSTTGMLPYPNGLVILGKLIFGHQIGRGDIVVVENETIREYNKKLHGESSGWVKRVVGLAEDKIELRDGLVYLNDQPLKEPYIAKARSTFGESFLTECKKIIVPKDSVFIMGDNRKGSGDSREIGFIEIGAIKYVLPLEKQKGTLDKNWHDVSKDLDESSKIRLDKIAYLELLNEKRKEAGARPLKYQPELERSALRRGEIIIQYDDFSYEATRSGYTQLRAMNDAGYSNITYGEIPILGYYERDELIENQFEFPKTKEFLLNKDFQEIGIAEVTGNLNGCPAQVIVLHFAGYVPPNYSKADIDSWKNILSQLKEIQPGWNKLKEYQNVYEKSRTEVDRINQIISIRISNIEAIVGTMDSNQWLTGQERNYINQDKKLFDEQEALANKLNGK